MRPSDPHAQARIGRYDQVAGDLARAYDAAVDIGATGGTHVESVVLRA